MSIKRSFFSAILLGLTPMLQAQESSSSSPSHWSKLIPTYAKAQYAGSIGAGAVGAGWQYGRQEQWTSDLMVGIVPSSASTESCATLTFKQSYMPWEIPVKESAFSITPLSCGLFATILFDDNYWIIEPSKYDPPYYSFSTQMLFSLHVGQQINYRIAKEGSRVKGISLYYEFSVCDKYLQSALGNKYLNPADYLSLGVGVRVTFR